MLTWLEVEMILLKQKVKERVGVQQSIQDRREKINQGIVPEGYKQTIVGIIPGDWEVSKFKDFSIKSRDRFYPKKDKGDYKCIELEHIESGNGILNGFISSQNVKSTKNKFVNGDILYGKLRPYLKKYYYADFSGVCSTEIWVLKANKKKVTEKYLFYLMQSNYFNYQANVSTGSSMPRADWNYVSKAKYAIPPVIEQQKIADVLATWDRAIELQESLIKEKEEQKKELRKVLLTSNKSKSWTIKSLGELVTRVKRKAVEIVENGKYPVLAMQFLNGDSEPNYTNDPSILADVNDILLLWDGENAGNIYTEVEGVVGSTFMRLRPDSVNSVFIREYMRKDEWYIRSIREGSGVTLIPGDLL